MTFTLVFEMFQCLKLILDIMYFEVFCFVKHRNCIFSIISIVSIISIFSTVSIFSIIS